MSYLIFNKKLENGIKIKSEKYRKNIVDVIKPEDLLYTELAYEDEVVEKSHFYGDVSIDLIKSPFLELHVSKYVYKLEVNEKNELMVKNRISDKEYMSLIYALFDLNVNTVYKNEYILLDTLKNINLNSINIKNLMIKIEEIFNKNEYIDGVFIKIMKVLIENIKDSSVKKNVINFMYNYLELNIKKSKPIFLYKDEEEYIFKDIKKELSPRLYSMLNAHLNNTIEENDLPF